MLDLCKRTLTCALLAACALGSGCASTLRNAGRGQREPHTATSSVQPRHPSSPQATAAIPTMLASPTASRPPVAPGSTQFASNVTSSTTGRTSVVQLAPPTSTAFGADFPTVGNGASLQSFYEIPDDARPAIETSAELKAGQQAEVATDSTIEAAALASSSMVNLGGVLMGTYVIETGDSLDIKFRNTPELDNVVTVRPDGMVSLEIVGDVLAAGLTPELMRQMLVSAYSTELNKPEIAVIVRSFSGNSIYVGGEVFVPGRVPLTGRITTLNAIILAGGFKDTADKQRVVVRHGDGTCCEYDMKSVIECEGQGQDIQLRPYDVVYVPKSKIAKVNLFVEQYIDKVLPFSRSFGIFVSHNTGITSAVGAP